MNDDNTPHTPTDRRPLGFWLRTVDALISREFADAFAGEGITRRDWMLLNALAGDVDTTWLTERLAGKGKRLRRLEDLGWAEEQGDGTWTLTDAGREAKDRLRAIVDGIRERVSGAVTPEDFATTMASLEAIARELGGDESMRMPHPGRPGMGRGFGPGRGFGRGFRPGFDPRAGFGGERCPADHPHAGHGHRHAQRHAERAYERGFDTGFTRGRDERVA